jgi:sugar diacid utilization regulator/putative methionine-R-sulfoxide reductase with GAF domain
VEASNGQLPSWIQRLLDAARHESPSLEHAALAAAIEVTNGTSAELWVSDGRDFGSRARLGEGLGQVPGLPRDIPSHNQTHYLISGQVDADTVLVVGREIGDQPFDRAELAALSLVANMTGSVNQQPRRALGALYDFAPKILSSLDPDAVLLSVVNSASSLLNADISGILLLSDSGETLDMRCVTGHRSSETAKLAVRPGQGLVGRVFQTGQVSRIDDYVHDSTISTDFRRIAADEGTNSAMCAPMKVGDRVIGCLCVWSRRSSRFAFQDERLLASLADLATVAIEKARLYDAQRTSSQQLELAHLKLARRFESAELAMKVREDLNRIAVQGDDLMAVLKTVHSYTRGIVALITDDLKSVSSYPTNAASHTLALLERHADAMPTADLPIAVLHDEHSSSWLAFAPVSAAGVKFGRLCVELTEPPAEDSLMTVEQASIVCALLLARQEAVLSTMRRLQSEFVWDLLEGRIPDEAAAHIRSRHLGHGFQLPARILLMSVDGLEEFGKAHGWDAELLERVRGRHAATIAKRVAEATMVAPVSARRGNLIAVVLPRPTDDQASAVSEVGALAISGDLQPGITGRVGISGPVNMVKSFPEALREAQFALSAAAVGHDPVVVFEQLGVLRFLLAPSKRSDLDQFAQLVLGRLLAYDAKHGTRLVATLDAYLASNCSLNATAKKVFIHPKTMSYRMQRIREISSLNLGEQEDLFNIQLALKILRLHGQLS